MKLLFSLLITLCLSTINCEKNDETIESLIAELLLQSSVRGAIADNPHIAKRFEFAINEWNWLKNQTLVRYNSFVNIVEPAMIAVQEFYKLTPELANDYAQNAFNATLSEMFDFVNYETKQLDEVLVKGGPYILTALNRIDSDQKAFFDSLKQNITQCSDLYENDELFHKFESGSNYCLRYSLIKDEKEYLRNAFKFLEIQNWFLKIFDAKFYSNLTIAQVQEHFDKVSSKSILELKELRKHFDKNVQDGTHVAYRCHANVVFDLEQHIKNLKETRNECFDFIKVV